MPSPKLTSLEIVPFRTGPAVPALGVPDTLDDVRDPVTSAAAQIDVLGEVYQAMAPGQGTSTVVLLASRAGTIASPGDPLRWLEVPGDVVGPLAVTADLPDGSPATWATYAVLARGGVAYADLGWVDPNDPGKGRAGSHPYLAVPCASADALGRAELDPADLAPLGGALAPGDRVVAVRCVPRPPVLRWSRDEPGRRRTYSGGSQPRLLVGGGPVSLGPFAPGTLYRLNPPPSGWPVGEHLPGDPSAPDAVAILRASSPGAGGKPIGPVLAVPAGTVRQDLDFGALGDAAAVIEPETGRCAVRPGAVQAGVPLWYAPLSFRQAGTGAVQVVSGELYIAPAPEVGETPLLRIGERLPLEVEVVDSEADLSRIPAPLAGQAAAASTTGRVLLSARDRALVEGGEELRYLGTWLGTAEQAFGSLHPQAGGYRVVPQGSVLRGIAGMVTRVGGKKSAFDGVGTPIISTPRGAPLAVGEVDLDAKLPPAAPEGQAIISQQSGRVALPASLPAESPAWVTSTTALLRRAYAGPRLRSMKRHRFPLAGTEKMWLAVSGRTFAWDASALGPGTATAKQVADSLGDALDPALAAVEVDRGCLVLRALGKAAWVEVLFGADPGMPDLSGCAALGFCPGWRAGISGADSLLVDLGIAVGLPADGLALARRFSGSVRDPIDPIPVVVLSTKPLEEDPGLRAGSAFWVERGGDKIPVRVGIDAAYDSSGGRLIWAARSAAEAEMRGPVARVDLTSRISNTLRVELEEGGTSRVLTQGVDFALDPAGAGEVRLLETVGGMLCGGTHGILSSDPPTLSDPEMGEDCARPGSRLRAGDGWYRAVGKTPTGVLLDRTPPPSSRGQVSWQAAAPPTGPLDPSIIADLTFVPVDYRGAYDVKVERSLLGEEYVSLAMGADFALDPLSGLLGLASPLPPGARLRASGYAADAAGMRAAPFAADLDLATIQADARRIGAVEYRFGESGPPPDRARGVLVRTTVLGVTQNRDDVRVDYPPDLGGAGRVVFPSDAPPEGAAVRVTYQSLEAQGGERLAQIPVNPVFASFVRLPAGQDYVGLRGDHTVLVRQGCLLRVGAACFWVARSTYYPPRPGGGDATRIDISPAPEMDAGSKGPADKILLLCSDRPVLSDPLAWVQVEVAGPLAPSTSQVTVRGISPGQVVQPGCILEIGGHPYAVAGASAGKQAGEVQVVLASPLARATASNPTSPRITARPVYPPGASSFAGTRIFTGPPPEVVLWPGGDALGRSLDPQEVDVDQTTGTISLLGGLVLPPGGQLEAYGQALRVVSQENGAWPVLRVSSLRMVQPQLEPGDRVAGNYLYYAPDTLRFSVEDPPALRVLTRADRLRQAELEDMEAMLEIERMLRLGKYLGIAVGAAPPDLPAPGSESIARRIAMGRPCEDRDLLEPHVLPPRVLARIEPFEEVSVFSGPWAQVGRLVDASEKPVSGVLKARAWMGMRILSVGAEIDVDEDGTVYLPDGTLNHVRDIEVEVQVAQCSVRVPLGAVGLSPRSSPEPETPLDTLVGNASFLLADKRIAASEVVRICLGSGTLDFRGKLALSPDTPSARILPGDLITVDKSDRTYKVVAVPKSADQGRWGMRKNLEAGPEFAPDGFLVVVPHHGDLPGAREEIHFGVSRTWKHSHPALLAPVLSRAEEETARMGNAAQAALEVCRAFGPEFEEVRALAAAVLQELAARAAALRAVADHLGSDASSTQGLAALVDQARKAVQGAPDALRRAARADGPYHQAVQRALERRYDPVFGTMAQLRRFRQA